MLTPNSKHFVLGKQGSDGMALRRFKSSGSGSESDAAYNRLVSSDSSKVELFEEIEAEVQRNAEKNKLKPQEYESTGEYAYNVMQSPDRNSMKRKPELLISTEEFLKTPVSNRGNNLTQVMYSGKGSGAVYSNRRNRF